jgi:hypothetical protein
MFSKWWPRLTVVWPKSMLLTGSLGLINPAENLGRHSAALERVTSRHGARSGPKLFQLRPLQARLSLNFWTKVHKVVNRKVVDLTTLYNFYKGPMVLFSTVLCINCSQSLNATLCQWTRPADSWPSFPPSSTQNLKCHSTWKLCRSKNWTTFLLREFEVFRWNLENTAKVPEDIQWHQSLSGVWPCLWPKFVHKCVLTWSRGSLGLVGEVFETQVDYDS